MEEIINPKKFFYKRMLTVALPVVIQHVISIGLNLVDTLMIGIAGENQLAAVGAANQIFVIFSTICFGLFSGAAVHVAQYWGVKDRDNIRKIVGMGFGLGFVLALLTFILVQLKADELIGLFAKNPEVIRLGSSYIRIVSFSYIITGLTFAITFNSRAVQILRVPTTINAVALLMNTTLNYMLIYGNWGMPKMDVEGAALATVIARIVEFISLVTYIICKKDHPFNGNIKGFFSFDMSMFKKVMKTALPVVLSEGGWAIGFALTFAAYGKISSSALAVVQVSNVLCQFCQCAFVGLANGSAVVIGETLGMGHRDIAFDHGKRVLKLAVLLNVFMVIMILALRMPVARAYQFNSQTTQMLMLSIGVFAFTMVPRMFAYVIQCGILRAGGDTIFCMKVELVCNLIIEVALAYFGVLILNLPLHYAIALASVGNITKATIEYIRYRSRKWINILI